MPLRRFAALALALLTPAVPAAEDAPDLARYYGFRDVEVVKLEQRSGNLRAADLDGDGLTDLVLVDNGHSRIDWLRQRPAPEPQVNRAAGTQVNALDEVGRFEHVKIPVDREVAALVVGDFDGDGRADLAYVGQPDRLVVKYAPAKDAANPSAWTKTTEQRLPDPAVGGSALAAGDVNGDGKADLVLLGKQKTYVVRQKADGTLAPADALMNTSEGLALAQIADLDGDGKADLSYSAADGGDRILCARLQTPQGTLGPEQRFPLAKPRSVTLANVDRKPGLELLTIDSTTDRLSVLQLQRPQAKPGELAGRLVQYGFGDQSTRNERDLAIGDVDGDGRLDVVVTDPAAAGMIVFRQREGAGLDLGTTFPGLTGAEQVRCADIDGDGKAEVYVLSEKEKTLGVSRFEDGRLTFPKPLPVAGKPAAAEGAAAPPSSDAGVPVVFDVADVTDLAGSGPPDGRPELVVLATGDGSDKYTFGIYSQQNGEWSGGQAKEEITLRGTPRRLTAFDGNGDGRIDFVAFLGQGRAPHVFVADDKGVPRELTDAGGIGLGEIAAGAFAPGVVFDQQSGAETPALLAALGPYARNLKLTSDGWRVVDQYNAGENGADIQGAATLDLDGAPGHEIVLIDVGVRKLRVLKTDGSLYQPWKEVETGPFPFVSARVADLNADGRDDLLLFGRGRFAVLYAGQSDPNLKEIASFESELKDVYFIDVTAGDLNADGYADLALLDTLSHLIEILDYDPTAGPRHATSFQVFEEKSFTSEGAAGTDPREATVADVTGDGRADLILLVHDRVLVYPQDDGTAPAAATPKPNQAEDVTPEEAGEVESPAAEKPGAENE